MKGTKKKKNIDRNKWNEFRTENVLEENNTSFMRYYVRNRYGHWAMLNGWELDAHRESYHANNLIPK